MKDLLAITKALSDSSRTRAVMALSAGELCVCQLLELLELAPSTVSKHMAVLHQAGLVETRKDGRWVYYRLPGKPEPLIRDALKWLTASLKADPQTLADAKRLKAVKTTDKDKLCARYNR